MYLKINVTYLKPRNRSKTGRNPEQLRIKLWPKRTLIQGRISQALIQGVPLNFDLFLRQHIYAIFKTSSEKPGENLLKFIKP